MVILTGRQYPEERCVAESVGPRERGVEQYLVVALNGIARRDAAQCAERLSAEAPLCRQLKLRSAAEWFALACIQRLHSEQSDARTVNDCATPVVRPLARSSSMPMTTLDVASLILRIAVGVTVFAHGYNHVFGGGGIDGTTNWFASVGLRPARLHAWISGIGEMAAGCLLIVGLLTSFSAAFVVGSMFVAGITVHRVNGFFIFREGYEYVAFIALTALALALIGPGAFSLDAALDLSVKFDGVLGAVIAGVGGVLGALGLIVACWRPARGGAVVS